MKFTLLSFSPPCIRSSFILIIYLLSGVSYCDLIWEDGTKLILTMMSRVTLVLSRGDRDFEFIAVIEKPDTTDQEIITLE